MHFFDNGNDEHVAVEARLGSARIAWLSTVRKNGGPQSVPVWFVWTGHCVVVFSGSDTAKLRHLRRQPLCALTLETEDGGNDVVLVDASARLAKDDDPDVAAATPRFVTKYADAMPDGFDAWRENFAQPLVLTPLRVVAWSKPGGALRYVVVDSN